MGSSSKVGHPTFTGLLVVGTYQHELAYPVKTSLHARILLRNDFNIQLTQLYAEAVYISLGHSHRTVHHRLCAKASTSIIYQTPNYLVTIPQPTHLFQTFLATMLKATVLYGMVGLAAIADAALAVAERGLTCILPNACLFRMHPAFCSYTVPVVNTVFCRGPGRGTSAWS